MKRLRNPYAWAPILRKGGVHRQTRSGWRVRLKDQLRNDLADCFESQEPFEDTQTQLSNND